MNAISRRDFVGRARRHHGAPSRLCRGSPERVPISSIHVSRARCRTKWCGAEPGRIRILRHEPDCGMLSVVPVGGGVTGPSALEQGWRKT